MTGLQLNVLHRSNCYSGFVCKIKKTRIKNVRDGPFAIYQIPKKISLIHCYDFKQHFEIYFM